MGGSVGSPDRPSEPGEAARSNAVRPSPAKSVALLLFLSGAAGLAHQLLWTRVMVDILGADSGTFATTVGSFFLGLSLGAAFAALRPPRRPARMIAAAECTIGLLALAILGLAQTDLPLMLPTWAGPTSKLLLPVFLVGIPAFFMGLVFPWAMRLASAGGRSLVFCYAVNTGGGVLGLLGVLHALPNLGTGTTIILAAALNFVAALVVAHLRNTDCAAPDMPASRWARFPRHLVAPAFASGCMVLSGEVAVQLQISQVTINSFYSSSWVLVAVLAALFMGSVLGLVFPRIFRLEVALPLAALAFAAQPLLFHLAAPGLVPLSWDEPPVRYAMHLGLILVIAVAPIFLCGGLIFPAVLRQCTTRSGVGWLLAANGIGGWIGAELTYRWLLPFFGLWQLMGVLACGYSAMLIRSRPRISIACFFVAVGVGVLAQNLPQVSSGSGDRVVEVAVGREGVVSTVRSGSNDWRILFNNAYSLGGSLGRWNQERQAHLPILLHGSPASIATLGVATGSTVAGVAMHPTVQEIHAIELSPLAAEQAQKHFAPFNRDVLDDPRVRLEIGDARWVIAANPGTHDLVIGDLFLPWRTGEGRLYTREHFEAVRRSLRRDGIFCQWLPLYQLTQSQFEAIARTFQSVFPDAFLIRGDFYSKTPIIGLVGGKSLDQIDWPAVSKAAKRLAETSASDPLVTHPEGVAMLLVGPMEVPDGPTITLLNGWLEWDAGRNIIGQDPLWFVGPDFLGFLDQSARSTKDLLPEHLQEAHRAGLRVATEASRPEQLLPDSISSDIFADWATWPGDVRPFMPGGDVPTTDP